MVLLKQYGTKDFERDFALGQAGAEVDFEKYLKLFYPRVSRVKPDSKYRKCYDFSVWGDKGEYLSSFEVKYDILSQRTGNAFFELYNDRNQKTGLLGTYAENFVVRYEPEGDFYMAAPWELMQYLLTETKCCIWKDYCGDGNARGVIVPLKDVKKNGFRRVIKWKNIGAGQGR